MSEQTSPTVRMPGRDSQTNPRAEGHVSALDRLARHCHERRLGFALYYNPDLAMEGFRFEVRVHGEPRRGEPRFVEWGVTAFVAAARALDRLIPTEESEGTDGSATAREYARATGRTTKGASGE